MSKATELRLLQGQRSIDAPVRFHNRSGDSEEAGSMLDYYAQSESAEEEYFESEDEGARGVFVKAFQLYLRKTLTGKERKFLRRVLSGKEKPQEVGRSLGVKWFEYLQAIQRKAFNNAEAFGRVVQLSGWSRAEEFAGTVFARLRRLQTAPKEAEELPREKKQAQARAMMKAFRESSAEEQRTAEYYNKRAWKETHAEKVRESHIKYKETHRSEIYARNEKWRETHTERVRELARNWKRAHREQEQAREKARYAANPEAVKERTKKYRKEHPEKVKEWSVKYYAKHGEKKRAKEAARYAEHAEERREKQIKYYEEHAEKVRAYQAKYRAEHAEEVRRRKAQYQARKKAEKAAAQALAGLLAISQSESAGAEATL